MRNIFLCSILLLSMIGFGVGNALAAGKVALIIGNTAYQNATPLKNPVNDATDLTKKLEAFGFTVITGLDLGHRAMRRTIEKFVDALANADTALFFYAGHALQVSGKNYLVPVDAELKSHLDLNFETIPIDFVLTNMEQQAKTNLIFLDACRDNPLSANLARSMGTRSAAVGQGLASIGTGVGTLVAFATEPGNVALDGTGRNSPYTAALLKHLGKPGEGLTRSLVNVRNAVLKSTGGKQVPWEHSSLTGEIILEPAPVKTPVAPKTQAKVEPVKPLVKQDPTVELAYWDAIKDAGTKVYFETYVNRYPNGLFKDIALLKIAELGKANVTPVKPAAIEVKPVETAKLETAPVSAAQPETESLPEIIAEPAKVSREPVKPAKGVTQKPANPAPKPVAREAKVAGEPVVDIKVNERAEALKSAKLALQKKTEVESVKPAEISEIAAVKPKVETGEPEEVTKITPDVKSKVNDQQTVVAALVPEKVEPKVETPTVNVEPVRSKRETVRLVQGELNRLGCVAGRADGLWGRGSKRALRRFIDNSNVKLISKEPDNSMLEVLKGEKGRICPLTCRRGFEVVGDSCERIKRKASVDPAPKAKPAKKSVKPKRATTKRKTTKRKSTKKKTTTKRRTAPKQKKRAQAKNRWCFRCPQTPNHAAGIQCFKRNPGSFQQGGRFCKAI